jgi:hypothetical protein
MSRPRYKSMEDYEASCNFGWKCLRCGHIEYTPAPNQYDEDDFDDPPFHCDEYMEPMEEL